MLYDSDCGFCKWSLNKILAWDRPGRLRPVAIQSGEGERLLADSGVPPAARLDSWHLVRADGVVRSAGAAAPELFEALTFGKPLAGLFRAFPATTERAYQWVARHRSRLGRLVGADASCELRR